jgi:hypothetical protein
LPVIFYLLINTLIKINVINLLIVVRVSKILKREVRSIPKGRVGLFQILFNENLHDKYLWACNESTVVTDLEIIFRGVCCEKFRRIKDDIWCLNINDWNTLLFYFSVKPTELDLQNVCGSIQRLLQYFFNGIPDTFTSIDTSGEGTFVSFVP